MSEESEQMRALGEARGAAWAQIRDVFSAYGEGLTAALEPPVRPAVAPRPRITASEWLAVVAFVLAHVLAVAYLFTGTRSPSAALSLLASVGAALAAMYHRVVPHR